MGGTVADLKRWGIKFSRYSLLWTLSTRSAGLDKAINTMIPMAQVARSRTIFLEKGSSGAGLLHIWKEHGSQFKYLCKVGSIHRLKEYLHTVISRGRYNRYMWYEPATGGGLDIVYYHKGVYIRVIMGSNGYIVTAYPMTHNPLST